MPIRLSGERGRWGLGNRACVVFDMCGPSLLLVSLRSARPGGVCRAWTIRRCSAGDVGISVANSSGCHLVGLLVSERAKFDIDGGHPEPSK